MADQRSTTSLRILCCHTPGALHPETAEALFAHAADRADLHLILIDPDDHYAYGRALAAAWADPRTDLAIVEPDIVVREDVIDAFLGCDCQYGGFPYSWGPEVGIALGCIRFRAAFLRRCPLVMEAALAKRVTWRQLDVVVQRHILVREYGEQPHICGATVEHLNPAKQLRPDADPTPIAALPAW